MLSASLKIDGVLRTAKGLCCIWAQVITVRITVGRHLDRQPCTAHGVLSVWMRQARGLTQGKCAEEAVREFEGTQEEHQGKCEQWGQGP